MAEKPTDSPKVEENSTAAAPPDAEADLASLEDLDSAIAASDPEFAQKLETFKADAAAADLHIELMDLEQLVEDEEAGLHDSKIKKFIKKIKLRIKSFSKSVVINLTLFIKEGLPELLRKTKTGLLQLLENIGEGRRQFSYWPTKKKLATVGLILGVIFTLSFIFFAATRPLLPKSTDLFTQSLEESADHVEIYDPATESELFYDSNRASQNIISLQKIVVNIKRSSQSGPNPMGAFEFFIEGNSPDVMVEIKDREYEVKDLFQRNSEEMSFDQLETAEGKQLLLEKLRRDVNRILTKGRVRKVFFKTVILKP